MARRDAPEFAAYRGEILHFVGDPAVLGDAGHRHFPDGVLVVAGGCVVDLGAADAVLPTLPAETHLTDYRGKLLLPGFVDTHIHYAQTDIIASHGTQLLEWLESYTFPEEARFADPAHAAEVAGFFIDELLRNGTTTAMVYATIHPASVDAIFTAAEAVSMRLIAGKVLMDRNAAPYLLDTATSGYEDSKTLIERWHDRGRLGYAVTPRFAPTSTPEQLASCGRLLDEHPGVFLQSHVAENRAEVAWAGELFPDARSYLDVYDRFGLVRPRAVYAHCIHLDGHDRQRMADAGAAMSFCATSNLFLGSGLFDAQSAADLGVRVGIGTDVGGGTSFSMLRTLDESYKVLQMGGQKLSPLRAFYLATLGGAASLYLDDRIGSFQTGREADFVVLDPSATPLMARRMSRARTLNEKLFALMIMGDDRAIYATHVLGQAMYRRDAVQVR
ncbi:MAG: guanine deaminase [Casimicrobiaceae bacterium]